MAKKIALQKKALLYGFKFFFIFFFLYALLFLIDIIGFQEWIASLVAGSLGIASSSVYVFVTDGVFEISKSCTGFVSSFLLAAILFPLKKPNLHTKLQTYFIGLVALLLVNIVRVWLVIWTGVHYNIQAAELMHIISWFVMSVAVLAVWYYLTLHFNGKKAFKNAL